MPTAGSLPTVLTCLSAIVARRVCTRVKASVTTAWSCSLAVFSLASERRAALVKRRVTSLLPGPATRAVTGGATDRPPRVSVKKPVQVSEQFRTAETPDLSAPGRPSASAATVLDAIARGIASVTSGQPLGVAAGSLGQASES